jgi:hypothetical protein
MTYFPSIINQGGNNMSRLLWHETGERHYETGTRNGVLYPMDPTTGLYPKGVAWNGLTGITQSPSGAEPTPLYADDIKYLNLISAEEFGATIEAYTYPDEFKPCDGSAELAVGVYVGQQSRQPFGLCYRTILGNEIMLNQFAYKLHLIYGAVASVSEKPYETVNDSPDAIGFSWDISTTPVNVPGLQPTAIVTIESHKVDAAKLAILEGILYGSNGTTGNATGGTVVMYTDLAAIESTLTAADAGKGWLVSSTNTVYIWDGTEFPASGEGVALVPTVPASVARLPLPNEVAEIFAAA